MSERLPPPWTVHRNKDAYWIEAANGTRFAFVYYRPEPLAGTDPGRSHVSEDVARRVVSNIARLPEIIRAVRGR